METCHSVKEDTDILRLAVQELGVKAGLEGRLDLKPLAGGRNNRVFRLEAGRGTFLLKLYFRHQDDPRDRLRQEFEFLRYLWSSGVRKIPEPIAADYDRNLGLYEFIEGRLMSLEEIRPGHVDEAIVFYRSVNAGKGSSQARRLTPASEAGFSISDHLEGVAGRIERLKKIELTSDLDRETKRFVEHQVIPLWGPVAESVRSEYRGDDALTKPLDEALRCLSPSDFGFHNALVERSGAVRFIDFEYAGWDDPAKLACDFANQPDMLLPDDLSLRFHEALIRDDPDPEALRRRILWLTPLYQIKWTCIILNLFLPFGRDRDRFIFDGPGRLERKRRQLEKARRMLGRAGHSYQVARVS